MEIAVRRTKLSAVEALRESYRLAADCQIVHYSILERGMADIYEITEGGKIRAYGAVWNVHYPGRVVEFYSATQNWRTKAPLFKALLEESGATSMEAQTNILSQFSLLNTFGADLQEEAILFSDKMSTNLKGPNARFRKTTEANRESMFEHKHEPIGEYVVEVDLPDGQKAVAATGGFLCHYNPPYADLYMEVAEPFRQKGIGSFLVQELKRACRSEGKVPAARCSPENVASRKTLEKAGMSVCGRLLSGRLRSDSE